MDRRELDIEARGYLDQLRAHRRALHRIPEIGEAEHKTQAYLMEQLRRLAPDDLRVFAGTGLRAVFRGNGQGRVVAFRADIDALPVTEETGAACASEIPGVMHACGHDVHTAAALGAAMLLSKHRDALCGTVKFLFQPDE